MSMTENETRRAIIAKHGRCNCELVLCSDNCAACAALDPEWPCYHDAETPWPSNPVCR